FILKRAPNSDIVAQISACAGKGKSPSAGTEYCNLKHNKPPLFFLFKAKLVFSVIYEALYVWNMPQKTHCSYYSGNNRVKVCILRLMNEYTHYNRKHRITY